MAKLNLELQDKRRVIVCSKLDDRFLTSARVQLPHHHLSFFPDLHTEVLRVWRNLYCACLHTQVSSTYSTLVGMREQGYGAMPIVEEMLAGYPLVALPTKPCQVASNFIGCGSRSGWCIPAHNGSSAGVPGLPAQRFGSW